MDIDNGHVLHHDRKACVHICDDIFMKCNNLAATSHQEQSKHVVMNSREQEKKD